MNELFSVKGKVAVVSGAAGVLGGSLARHFASEGADVVALVHREEQVAPVLETLREIGGRPCCFACDVMDVGSLKRIVETVLADYGHIDALLNIAGGQVPGSNVMPGTHFWDLPQDKWEKVLDLNLNGTVYPCQVFAEVFARQGFGCIVNISSMAAYEAITRVPGYGVAKEGVSNFTKWLAMELALKYGDKIRVNALAPGFFIGKQNRCALLNDDGSLTERSVKVIAKTPMGRFGDITELNGAAQFLCSDAASFVTGVVLPVDGGFSSFSGV
jgi:NAD(P)-dependent dehydrogenase (short-subunit alcohol dehydrogenase family)